MSRAPRSRLRPLALAGLGLGALLLHGCGAQDALEDGSELSDQATVELVGVIRTVTAASESFLSRALVVTAAEPVTASELARILDQVLAGATVRERLGEEEVTERWRIAPPLAVSLDAAAATLLEDTRIAAVEPSAMAAPSTGATLVETAPGYFLDEGRPVVELRSVHPGLLEVYDGHSVVRVRGTMPLEALPLDPTDVVEVDSVQILGEYRSSFDGKVHVSGVDDACVLLVMDDGRTAELVGPKVDILRGLDWAHGARIDLRAADAGLSTVSCGGGRRLEVRQFVLARRE